MQISFLLTYNYTFNSAGTADLRVGEWDIIDLVEGHIQWLPLR